MRVESNNARWPFQQLRLVIQRGLTCRLYVLYYQIEGIKLKLEVCQTTIRLLVHLTHSLILPQLAIDKKQLRMAESANRTAVVSPATGMHLSYYMF